MMPISEAKEVSFSKNKKDVHAQVIRIKNDNIFF
jgi:hypothetical protein